jgi:hypothetical protein
MVDLQMIFYMFSKNKNTNFIIIKIFKNNKIFSVHIY